MPSEWAKKLNSTLTAAQRRKIAADEAEASNEALRQFFDARETNQNGK